MLFVIHCVDKPDHGQVRADNRPAHLEHLKAHGEQIITAGPTLDDDGAPNGSVLIVEFADRAAAEKFAADDPYSKAGLFQRVEIKPWKKTFP